MSAALKKKRGRLLVIDDEPIIGKAVKRLLGFEHEVKITTSADEAMGWLRSGERFDLILCDVLMPERTGIEFYHQVATEVPEQAARVVLITGGVVSRDQAYSLEGFPGERLEKPFNPDELKVFVRSFVPEARESA